MARCGLQPWPPRETPGDVGERERDAVELAIRLQPALVADPRVNDAQQSRQRVDVRVDQRERPREKIVQRLAAELLEADGQKVVEENVGDDPRVVAVLGNEDAPEGGYARMRVGERIDAPML